MLLVHGNRRVSMSRLLVHSTNCTALEWLFSSLPMLTWRSKLQWLADPEYRRKLRWDVERLRWRHLQQQLGELRVIRASRVAEGTHWKTDELQVADTILSFPWKDQPR